MFKNIHYISLIKMRKWSLYLIQRNLYNMSEHEMYQRIDCTVILEINTVNTVTMETYISTVNTIFCRNKHH